jgi:LysR family transcriptional regulator, transcriptional activator of the cysJI operon
MLNLYKLEIFNIVAMEGSFSRAAARMLLTQPAVSQHIKDLETNLKTDLFKRSSKGVVLTPAGETLLDYTRCILKLLAEAEEAILSIRDLPDVEISLGATPGVGVNIMPVWIQSFKNRHPPAKVKVKTDITSVIVSGVSTGQLDVGFVEGEIDPHPPIQTLPLMEIELFLMVGSKHPWSQKNSIKMRDLAGESFISRPAGSQTRTWIDLLFNQHDITPNIVAEFDQPEAIMSAVASGLGVTILPDWGNLGESTAKLKALRIEGIRMARTIKLVWSKSYPFKPVALAFLSQLIDQFPQLTRILALTPADKLQFPERDQYRSSSSCRESRLTIGLQSRSKKSHN